MKSAFISARLAWLWSGIPGTGLSVDSSQLSRLPAQLFPLSSPSLLSLRVIPPLQLGEHRRQQAVTGDQPMGAFAGLCQLPGLSFMHNSADVGPQR